MDYLGADVYVDLSTAGPEPTSVDLAEVWRSKLGLIEEWLVRSGLEIRVLAMEVGYKAEQLAFVNPNDPPQSPYDEVTQSKCLELMFEATAERDFFAGSLIWLWYHKPEDTTTGGLSYSPQGKLAEDVVSYWWSDANLQRSWHNAVQPVDVNNDRFVSPVDALAVINVLNSIGPHRLRSFIDPSPPPFIDVNNDGWVTAADALGVINYLNTHGSAEAEAFAPFASLAVARFANSLTGFSVAPPPALSPAVESRNSAAGTRVAPDPVQHRPTLAERLPENGIDRVLSEWEAPAIEDDLLLDLFSRPALSV